jgi:hypothetical protein
VRSISLAALALAATVAADQRPAVVQWIALLTQPSAWYGSPEAIRISDAAWRKARGN